MKHEIEEENHFVAWWGDYLFLHIFGQVFIEGSVLPLGDSAGGWFLLSVTSSDGVSTNCSQVQRCYNLKLFKFKEQIILFVYEC